MDRYENELRSVLPVGDWRTRHIFAYYRKPENKEYLPQLVSSIRGIKILCEGMHDDEIGNSVKCPRAGFTTNAILACLVLDKKIMVMEPTNAIADKTVLDALEIYEKMSGDLSKRVRKIPANEVGCSIIFAKVDDDKRLSGIPFIKTPKCSECKVRTYKTGERTIPSATRERCTIKTMMKESYMDDDTVEWSREFSPDIITITYDKARLMKGGERNEFFMEYMKWVEVVLLDEFGDYISKGNNGIEIRRKEELYIKSSGEGFTASDEESVMDFLGVKKEEIDIVDMKRRLVKYIVKIKNRRAKKRWLIFMDKFLNPFLDKCEEKIKEEFDDNKRAYPYSILNPLSNEYMWGLVSVGPIKKKKLLPKNEVIIDKVYENVDYLIDLMESSTEVELQEVIEWLLGLVNIMSGTMLYAYTSETVRDLGDTVGLYGMKVKNVNISVSSDDIMGTIKPLLVGKKILITDATMPAVSFSGLGKVSNLFFGDPINSNGSVMYFYDDSMKRFSMTAWNNDRDLRIAVMDRIVETCKLFDNDIVVWCTNKKVTNEIMEKMNKRGIETCSYEEEEPGKVLVSYYGSNFARGMKCNRRVTIALGKATKPMKSYEHVFYECRDSYKPFKSRELSIVAKNSGLTYDELVKKISEWNKTSLYREHLMRVNYIPNELMLYFKLCSRALQSERTDMDTFQALNRTKDPRGKEKSVVVCLGWDEYDVMSCLRWGANDTVSFIPTDSGLKRIALKQDNIIAPPRFTRLHDMDDVNAWVKGGKLKCSHVGFNSDLFSILNLLMLERNREVDSEELWIEASKNLSVGEISEKCDNGYIVGSIRAIQKWNNFGDNIIVTEYRKGHFKFSFVDVKHDTFKGVFVVDELTSITEVLKASYAVLARQDRCGIKELRKYLRGHMSDREIHNTLMKIYFNGLLKNSTWSMEIEERTLRGKLKVDIEIVKGAKVRKRTKVSKSFELVCKVLLKWVDDKDTTVLRVDDIVDELIKMGYPYFNSKVVRTGLMRIFPESEDRENDVLGCRLITSGSDMFVAKKKIRLDTVRSRIKVRL